MLSLALVKLTNSTPQTQITNLPLVSNNDPGKWIGILQSGG